MSPTVYAATFGDGPLNDPALGFGDLGSVEPSPPPQNADLYTVLDSATQLRCIWRDPRADITGLNLTVGTVDPAVVKQYFAELAGQGYDCRSMHGGERCQLTTTDDTYGVGVGQTAFLRGNTYIYVFQANFSTNDLLGSVVERMWG